MPPFREVPTLIDRNLSGDVLKELREVGHGHRINIVDASYDIPRGTHVLDYPGSTADAIVGIVQLIPVENNEGVYMEPDEQLDRVQDQGSVAFAARSALIGAQDRLKMLKIDSVVIDFDGRYRLNEQEVSRPGFYTMANNPHENTTFIRTIDNLPYACASFIVGHSQRTE